MKKIDKRILYYILSFCVVVLVLLLLVVPLISKNNKQNNNGFNTNVSDNEDFNDDDFEDEEEEARDKYIFSLDDSNKKIIFYKYNEEQEKYVEFTSYKNDNNYYFVCGQFVCVEDSDEGIYILHNDNDKFLYVNLEENIFEQYDTVYVNDELKSIIVSKNKKYGIIDKYGKYIYDLKAEAINQDGTFKLNKKYGLLDLFTGEVLITPSNNKIEKVHDLIYYENDNKYYKLYENNKWYVYSLDTKDLVIDKGFESVYYILENYWFEVSNGKGYIINENAERLNDMPITIYFDITGVPPEDCACFYYEDSVYMYLDENEDFLEIVVLKEPVGDEGYDEENTEEYKFDLKTYQLFKIR